MSKYSQEEQSNIVGVAAELEAAIIAEKDEITSLKAEYLPLPAGPKMKTVQEPQYVKNVIPKNKRQLFSEWASNNGGVFKFLFKHNYLPITLIIALSLPIGFLISFILIPTIMNKPGSSLMVGFWVMLIFVAIFVWAFGLSKSYQNKYFSSDAWKSAVSRETDAVNKVLYDEYMVRYNEAANEYNAAAKKYNDEVMPGIQKQMAIWKKSHDAKIAFVENDLKENVEALEMLYSSTQLIPSSYRTIDRLTWLYEDMSTSEHDIERSIDLLNSKEIKEELINIQSHVDSMRQDLRDGFVGVYAAIQEGNEIHSEMLENLDSIRKSARLGNFMNIGNLLQNHKGNKLLSQINNKM